MKKYILKIFEIYEYRYMIIALTRRDLRGRYKGSFLGFLWNFVNPLCQIIVYIIVFSQIFRSGLEYYYIYLMVGIMPWNFFADSLNQGSGCIFMEADMVKKIYFPREVLVISAVTSRFINFLISYAIVLLLIMCSRMPLNVKGLPWLVPVFIVEYIFTLGVTLILAALDVYFRDVQYMVGVFMMALIWMAPIMYSEDMLVSPIDQIVKWNPMTPIINSYHNILYWRLPLTSGSLSSIVLLAFVILAAGEFIFMELEKNFAEEL